MRQRLLLTLVLVAGGCLSEPGSRCGAGVCAAGKVCDSIHGGCVDPEQLASCAGQADEAGCSAPGIADGACFEGVCLPRGCGNGQLEADEVCDDGNNLFGDGCSADCVSDESCGNGVVDSAQGEACDDGNTNDGDGCQAACVLSTCGDGIVDEFENCDDGAANSDDPDGACRTNCQPQGCGDGITDSGEICDDGNIFAGDGCTPDCASDETCGNGSLDAIAGELCDDGSATLSHDGCGAICLPEQPAWTEVSLSASPSKRDRHAMTYDAARGRIVLFGGDEAFLSPPLRDTFEWDGERWFEVTPPNDNPIGDSSHTIAYDADRGRTVLLNRSGTWEWNGLAWKRFGVARPPTGFQAMAYDAARRRVVSFGGLENSLAFDETWQWDGARWLEVTPASASPPARWGHAMTFDASRGRITLFGGIDSTGQRLDDTWEWDGTSWEQRASEGVAPGPRDGHVMAYDAARGVVVLFGGQVDNSGTRVNDTWEWDGESWSDVTPAAGSPEARADGAMTYDLRRQRIVMFGGSTDQSGDRPRLDDLWEWDGTSWREITPVVEAPPSARGSSGVAYEGAGRIVLFGGGTTTTSSETWRWDGTWTQLVPEGAIPPGRLATAMASDRARGRVIMFGGSGASGALSDTWAWDGTQWTEQTPEGISPPARQQHAMAYDAARDRVVLFGGFDEAFARLGDTWEWDGNEWTEVTVAEAPPARAGHAMAYDAARGRVVMFSGSFSGNSNDTWEFDGATWAEVTPSEESPSKRFSHMLAYDAVRQRVVLFGGDSNLTGPLNDLWEWDGARWTEITPSSGSPSVRFASAMVYDEVRAQTVLFGGKSASVPFGDTWQLRHKNLGDPGEACELGVFDYDGDSVLGCDDPDCWGYCTPLCPPGATCDPDAPHCGDGVCNPNLETQRLCPGDCGAPPEICGDFICEGAEDSASCPGDCPP